MTSSTDERETIWQSPLASDYEQLCEREDNDECCYYKQPHKSTCLHACVIDHFRDKQ